MLGAYIENVMNLCEAVFGSSSVVRRADELLNDASSRPPAGRCQRNKARRSCRLLVAQKNTQPRDFAFCSTPYLSLTIPARSTGELIYCSLNANPTAGATC